MDVFNLEHPGRAAVGDTCSSLAIEFGSPLVEWSMTQLPAELLNRCMMRKGEPRSARFCFNRAWRAINRDVLYMWGNAFAVYRGFDRAWGEPCERRRAIDLTIMHSQGTSRLQHLLLGGTMEKVVRHARSTVTVAGSHQPGCRFAPINGRSSEQGKNIRAKRKETIDGQAFVASVSETRQRHKPAPCHNVFINDRLGGTSGLPNLGNAESQDQRITSGAKP
ncbi:MAG: universal stress protein [Syntrophobacteraceae bacterium]